MKVKSLEQVFNLFDTNGRRKDTINAYNIYCNILNRVYEESESGVWGRYPNESTQLRFYKLAIEESPEIFKQHPKYDAFIKALEDPIIKAAFSRKDISYLKSVKQLKELYSDLDAQIEGRARHYTSNLVKIGLADEQRQLSQVAKSWIYGKTLKRSRFENLLPIDDTNLLFLRQLLKLRIYTNECKEYYSPMMMAIYILLNTERISEDDFISIIQMLNPYKSVEPSVFIQEFINGGRAKLQKEYIPNDSKDSLGEVNDEPVPMSDEVFNKYFISGKSKEATKVYKEFYEALIQFNCQKTKENLKKIVQLFSDNRKKNMINKAFGFGSNVFKFDRNCKSNVNKFIELNKNSDILENKDLNKNLLLQFKASKRHDSIREYGDITRRIMKVTGIISFKNGVVELRQRDLWEKLFENIDIKDLVFNKSTEEEYDKYEGKLTSTFLNHCDIEKIFKCDEKHVEETIEVIKNKLNLVSEDEIKNTLRNETSIAFIKHIEENYPKEKILEILPLFSDRKNDAKIQKIVAENTDVPTIFEYIVGIAWYYISSEKYDVFSSFNLSMSADFEPETHAGGGTGDIVINYKDYILMIEVTLMNKQAQKRGEWEPVLRHATNLTIEHSTKEVVTLFIADELDENTINIWRAVATVPLQSSKCDKFTESVTIMPLRNTEIVTMLEKSIKDTMILENIRTSFNTLSSGFDMKWRDKILNI